MYQKFDLDFLSFLNPNSLYFHVFHLDFDLEKKKLLSKSGLCISLLNLVFVDQSKGYEVKMIFPPLFTHVCNLSFILEGYDIVILSTSSQMIVIREATPAAFMDGEYDDSSFLT